MDASYLPREDRHGEEKDKCVTRGDGAVVVAASVLGSKDQPAGSSLTSPRGIHRAMSRGRLDGEISDMKNLPTCPSDMPREIFSEKLGFRLYE